MTPLPFQIVLGSHDVTPIPTAARAHALQHRFALVQSTFLSEAGEMVEDTTALDVVRRALNRHCGPPSTPGEWRRGPELVVLLHIEEWCAIGGPEPYHDSLTYSFYSDIDLSELLLGALRAAGREPTAVISAAGELARALPGGPWGLRAHFAALGMLLLIAVAELFCALFGCQPRLDGFTDRAGAWLSVPLIASGVYASVYAFLLYRRKRT
jgi:hypothetical protein